MTIEEVGEYSTIINTKLEFKKTRLEYDSSRADEKKLDCYFSEGNKSFVFNFEGIKIPITPFKPTLIIIL